AFSSTFAPANVSARAERNISSSFSADTWRLIFLLVRNRAGNFCVGRLMEFLTALRQDVHITVRPSRKPYGAYTVVSA
ncbi:MAG TPA: hypothetical protein VJW94_20260, partial [Candidatus Acidoferrum sp.]|nr:hypothetical protein [Candidatus Acidoferrum sp.]